MRILDSSQFLKLFSVFAVLFVVVLSYQIRDRGATEGDNPKAPAPGYSYEKSGEKLLPGGVSSAVNPKIVTPVLPAGPAQPAGPGSVSNKSGKPQVTVTAPLPASKQAGKILSQEEIFKILYPVQYLNYLDTLQGLMIKDGFMDSAGKQQFNSEDEILSFWRDKAFDYLASINIFLPGDRERFYSGLAILKKVHEFEATLYQPKASATDKVFAAEAQKKLLGRSFRYELPAGTIAYLLQKVSDFLSPKAYADCFFPGGDPVTPGPNLTAPCCFCTAGGVPIGCLNAVCPGQGAIYDETTFICGCGL